MLNLSAATRVFVAVEPVDLRGSFNRLSACVRNTLQCDPISGHLFVFTNRSRNRIKVLFWDGSGLWVCAKRLEKGRFSWPSNGGTCASMRPEELMALITGLEVQSKRTWYRA